MVPIGPYITNAMGNQEFQVGTLLIKKNNPISPVAKIKANLSVLRFNIFPINKLHPGTSEKQNFPVHLQFHNKYMGIFEKTATEHGDYAPCPLQGSVYETSSASYVLMARWHSKNKLKQVL